MHIAPNIGIDQDTRIGSNNARLDYLDSLRGLAALAVALNHCWLSFRLPGYVFVAATFGKLPVLFFFILSGFVLGKSLQSEQLLDGKMVARFYIKRFFRLYPPIFFIVLISLLLARNVSIHQTFLNLSDWGQSMVQKQRSSILWPNCLKEFALFQFGLNTSLWSLAVEFPCSLLLPFIHILCEKRRRWIIPALILSAVFMLIDGAILNLTAKPDYSSLLNFTRYTKYEFAWSISPVKFIFAFFIGYLVSRKNDMGNVVQVLRNHVIAVFGFTAVASVYIFLFADKKTVGNVGASIIIGIIFVYIVYLPRMDLKSFLMLRPIHFIGRISYSFYLLHFPMLMFTLAILARINSAIYFKLPSLAYFTITVLLSLIFTISIGSFLEKYIERPFNKIGHKISSLIP